MYHKKSDLRATRSKDWIYEALLRLMQTKEYNNITITELIKTAGVGRSTFYRNFDTLDDVLQERLDREFAQFYKYIFKQKETHIDFSPKLFIPVFEYWKDDTSLFEVLLKANRVSLLSKIFTQYVDAILKRFDLIELSKQDLAYSAVIISGIIQAVMFKWIQSGKKESSTQLANIIEQTVFREKHISY